MHIVIIGNGVAGITTARHLRKLTDHRLTVISAESAYHYSRPALMYQFMGHLEASHLKPYEDWFWKKNRIDLIQATVTSIDTDHQRIVLQDGSVIAYDMLVLATGSRGRSAEWPGVDLHGVQTFTSLRDLELLERNVRDVQQAVIVGGGLIGVEVAEMLRTRNVNVTMLVREPSYWSNVLPEEESRIVTAHIRSHGVDVRTSTTLHSIHGDSHARVQSVECSPSLQRGELECQLVVVAIGVEPVTELAANAGIDVGRGIRVNDLFETSAKNVYAIGDCAEFGDGRVDLLWYTARSHGEHAARVIAGSRQPYRRDVFFNSAKFFDLEYQTYGDVPAVLDGLTSWTWAASDGLRFVRIVSDTTDGSVVGVNALGVRMRQRTWPQWITEQRSTSYVRSHIREACFDPEFSVTPRELARAATMDPL